MFEGESDAEADPDLATPRGSERDMVAPACARYDKLDVTKGPSFTGKKQDWANFDFKLKGFLDNHDLETTLLGKDEDKDSEDAEKRAEARRRNRIVFAGTKYPDGITYPSFPSKGGAGGGDSATVARWHHGRGSG
eukprot:167853-Prymnesium_polylepis.2